MNQTALIVEGGAMRGIFASGVLDAFLESRHNPFDLVIGVSAGAANLLGYLSQQRRRSYHIITELASSGRFFDPLRFVRGGDLVDVGWLWQASFERYPLDWDVFDRFSGEFCVVATEVASGEPRYVTVTPDNLLLAMQATSAMPLVQHTTPVINGEILADGGISDSIPVIEAYRRGARHLTVILSEPWGYRLKAPRFSWLLKQMLTTEPALACALLRREQCYNQALDFIAHPPADCHIELIAPPADFAVARFTRDRHRLETGYLQGYWRGRQALLGDTPLYSAHPVHLTPA